ncbi:MAG: SpoIID/LytB domain-containing protein [Nitriliruptorales bacterium]|nr:SpoIID/LytB domain-containing protein [Nitriliruptorales bacterium]
MAFHGAPPAARAPTTGETQMPASIRPLVDVRVSRTSPGVNRRDLPVSAHICLAGNLGAVRRVEDGEWPCRHPTQGYRRDTMGSRAVVAGAALMSLLFGLLVQAPLANAAVCPAPGGGPISRTTTQTGDFVVIGGGFGHGVGLSQYGAKGAASLGCTRGQILRAYYPGATVASSLPAGRDNIRVGLVPSEANAVLPSHVDIQAVTSGVSWRLGGVTRSQPAGHTWRASVGTGGRYTVKRGTTTIFSAADGPLRITLKGSVVRLPAKNHRYNRGVLVLSWAGLGARTFVTNIINSLDRYLYGLAEMPSAWPRAALRAQAVAGRSYALQRRQARDTNSTKWATCRCDVYDSVSDQAYSGYDWESVAPRWVAAVDATRGKTLRHAGVTATAFYHSSSGGYVESSAFVFGSTLPYSTTFDDSRWERASGNPNTTWVRAFSAEQIGAAFGVGVATAIQTPPPKGPSGRIGDPARGAGGVVIQGTYGTTTVSGPFFRTTLGLPSALFRVKSAS